MRHISKLRKIDETVEVENTKEWARVFGYRHPCPVLRIDGEEFILDGLYHDGTIADRVILSEMTDADKSIIKDRFYSKTHEKWILDEEANCYRLPEESECSVASEE